MGLIIDTNVFVQWERSGHSIDFSRWQNHGEAAISVMTASELLVGVHRADTEARRQRRSAFGEAFSRDYPCWNSSEPSHVRTPNCSQRWRHVAR